MISPAPTTVAVALSPSPVGAGDSLSMDGNAPESSWAWKPAVNEEASDAKRLQNLLYTWEASKPVAGLGVRHRPPFSPAGDGNPSVTGIPGTLAVSGCLSFSMAGSALWVKRAVAGASGAVGGRKRSPVMVEPQEGCNALRYTDASGECPSSRFESCALPPFSATLGEHSSGLNNPAGRCCRDTPRVAETLSKILMEQWI